VSGVIENVSVVLVCVYILKLVVLCSVSWNDQSSSKATQVRSSLAVDRETDRR